MTLAAGRMLHVKSILALSACVLLTTACGSSAPDGTAPGPQDVPDAGEPDAAGGEQWVTLLEGHWQLAPGEETHQCVRKTLDQDFYVRGFRALSPVGTHHTVLVAGAPQGADGIGPCAGGGFGANMIFGSGVGTGEIVFPDGLALHLRAGQQLAADLHLFNTGAEPIEGDSGTAGLVTTAEAATNLVDNMLAGPLLFSLPPNQTSVVTGDCTMDADVQIIAVQPHMHWLGVHQKVVAKSAQGDIVLHDGDYSFDSQVYYPVSPAVALAKGEKLHIECTYDNTTGATVTFGDSTTNEMCLASVYRYPASGTAGIICAN